jgi:hypothetical protein
MRRRRNAYLSTAMRRKGYDAAKTIVTTDVGRLSMEAISADLAMIMGDACPDRRGPPKCHTSLQVAIGDRVVARRPLSM